MAVCDACQLEMLEAASCTVDVPARRYGDESPYLPLSTGDRCRDCGVVKGGVHHPGCIVAECNECAQQFVLCDGTDCDEVYAITTGAKP